MLATVRSLVVASAEVAVPTNSLARPSSWARSAEQPAAARKLRAKPHRCTNRMESSGHAREGACGSKWKIGDCFRLEPPAVVTFEKNRRDFELIASPIFHRRFLFARS